VRTVLVPAVMHSLGKANWYLPRALERRLPHLSLEDHPGTSSGPDGEADETTPEPSLSGV
jgi:RND superfamily putative drug exporter